MLFHQVCFESVEVLQTGGGLINHSQFSGQLVLNHLLTHLQVHVNNGFILLIRVDISIRCFRVWVSLPLKGHNLALSLDMKDDIKKMTL